MEDLKDEVVTTIRGVLVSTKGSSDVRRLQKDYRMIIGEDIPYRRLGYKSLEDFLSSEPSLRVSKRPNGEILIDAVTSAQSKHISQLVDRQKASKKKFSYSSHKYKTSPGRFGVSKYKNPKFASKPFNPKFNSKPVFNRRHSDSNPNYTSNYKPNMEKRRSVFERLGPKVVVCPECDDSDSFDEFVEEEDEIVPKKSQPSISDRLQKYRNTEEINDDDNEQDDPEEESPTRPFRNPYPSEVKNEELFNSTPSTSTKPNPPSRLQDILNKISDLKLNPVENKPPPSLEKENRISGPTNRMNDILNKVSKELASEQFSDEYFAQPTQIPEETIPNEEINHRRYSMPAFGMSAPKFSVPDIDRPRMRSQQSFSNLPITPAAPVSQNFQFNPPFPSNPVRTSIQSRLHQHKHINFTRPPIPPNIPENPINEPQEIKQQNNAMKFTPQIPRFEESPQEKISPIILEETTNTASSKPVENCFISYRRNNIPRFQKKIESPQSPNTTSSEMYNHQSSWVAKGEILRGTSTNVQPFEKENVIPNSSPEQRKEQGNPIPVITGIRSNPEQYCDKVHLVSPEDTWELLTRGTIIEVTCVVSPVKIWCRLLNSSSIEVFHQLMCLLGIEYTNESHYTSQFFVGGYFVAHLSGCWYRVRVLQVLENDCECLLIDHGDEVIIPQNELRKLKKQFAHVPAQAVQCRLAGLEELVNYSNTLSKLQELNEQRYYAIQNKTSPINESHNVYSIDLFEITKTGNGKKDISLNQLLLKQIIEDSVVISLSENDLNKGLITYVDPSGDIFVRIESEGLNKFYHLLSNLSENHVALNVVKQPVQETVYLLKNLQTRLLERCKILDQNPSGKYGQFLFIDSGRIAIFEFNNLTLYSIDSNLINTYPPLAIKLRLDLDEIPKDFAERIQYSIHCAQNQLRTIRLLRFHENVPICDIFMQDDFGKNLISLKSELVADMKTEVMGKLDDQIPSNEEESDVKVLPAHDIPAINSFLDVRVVLTINPSHFYVQLYTYAMSFKELMKKLQEKYNEMLKTGRNSHNLKIGGIYALKHIDNIWYRVQIIEINTNQVHVFFVDFGYEIDAAIDSLYHLESQFCKLPHQAVKMKIAGIKPKFGNWCLDDGEYFDSLVNNKPFVCRVVNVENSNRFEIGVEIIDTTQKEDVNIGQFLVDVGLAAFNR